MVVSRERNQLLALMLTSKDHNRDAAWEARHGRYWFDVGTGARTGSDARARYAWTGRSRLPLAAVRREGAALDRGVFDAVAAAAQQLHARR